MTEGLDSETLLLGGRTYTPYSANGEFAWCSAEIDEPSSHWNWVIDSDLWDALSCRTGRVWVYPNSRWCIFYTRREAVSRLKAAVRLLEELR